MPYTPATVFADTDVMNPTLVQAEFTAARAWANAVPVADMIAGAIRREHLYKPESYGFPVNGTVTDFQRAHGHYKLTGFPMTIAGSAEAWWEAWSNLHGRESIYLDQVQDADQHIIPSLTQRVQLEDVGSTWDVRVDASWVAMVMNDDTEAVAYPANQVGIFRLRRKEVGVQTVYTDMFGTTRNLFRTVNPNPVPPSSALVAVPDQIRFNVTGHVSGLAAGTWDFAIIFDRNSTSGLAFNQQVVIGWQSMTIEVYKR